MVDEDNELARVHAPRDACTMKWNDPCRTPSTLLWSAVKRLLTRSVLWPRFQSMAAVFPPRRLPSEPAARACRKTVACPDCGEAWGSAGKATRPASPGGNRLLGKEHADTKETSPTPSHTPYPNLHCIPGILF